MKKISAVIITYNEEKNIQKCIEALQYVVDEIVVIDSFSTDNTAAICNHFQVEFIENAFEDYATQKNFGNTQAEHEYILSVDADEVLSPKLQKSIADWKRSGKGDVMEVDRITNFCGKWIKHSGWYPDKKIRLFDKTKARWAGEKVHEFLKVDADAKKGKLQGRLLHYSFHTIEQHVQTVNKFSTLKAEIKYEKGEKATFFKLMLSPMAKFFKIYFLKFGFMDGWSGFVIAKNSAFGDYLKYAKLKQMHLEKKK